ncbi:Stp1/IreP family PP2C-type Ser/Thr phosphatase [Proteiniborus sp. MB09-C3]|uniref:Stp1/IreP family PP2C-type Ser/Thr phosphatase n=1 Tax=Proteiniborus sp. MB09-C3 TaxID=3050072 RepID=UPI0025543A6A|nr:Stp1/IreP family PP2C-type Ser/Thr phosphatase [Proteiniborus sp. MB09-C3]WIV10805.1 Stp1/IreP family PP2C-type Ser/Thr phosphatase [Proteiniborus sp. MB09-C3]
MFICACSDIGKVRNINQDSYYYSDDSRLPLFVVADGMGGHNAGEVASSLAIDTIKENYKREKENIIQGSLDIPRFINLTLMEANNRILKEAKENDNYVGMGTTITLGIIYNDEVFIGHMGDSRAYLFREQELYQLTQDHSLVAELVRNGSISTEEAVNHPQKNIITRALGTDNDIKVDIINRKLDINDVIILCTDGLTNLVADLKIREILNSCCDLRHACCLLTDVANELGGFDNTTVMIIRYVEKR